MTADPNLVVEQLIRLRDELWLDRGRSIEQDHVAFKINSCLQGTYTGRASKPGARRVSVASNPTAAAQLRGGYTKNYLDREELFRFYLFLRQLPKNRGKPKLQAVTIRTLVEIRNELDQMLAEHLKPG